MIKVFTRFIKEWVGITKWLIKDYALWLQQMIDDLKDEARANEWKVK